MHEVGLIMHEVFNCLVEQKNWGGQKYKDTELGSRNGKRQGLQVLVLAGEAGDKTPIRQASQVGLEMPHPLPATAGPASAGFWLPPGSMWPGFPDLMFSKDDRNANFLIYKYQELNF